MAKETETKKSADEQPPADFTAAMEKVEPQNASAQEPKKNVQKQDEVVNENTATGQSQTAQRTADQPVEKAPGEADKAPAVPNQVDHEIDAHTGAGTAFPQGSPMSVVPPTNKQVI